MSWGTVDKMREEMNLASYALDGIRYWKDEVVCEINLWKIESKPHFLTALSGRTVARANHGLSIPSYERILHPPSIHSDYPDDKYL